MSRFQEWTLAKLDKRFGLDQVMGDSMLKSWLEIRAEITDFEKTSLSHLQGLLILNIDNWNEQEYALHFIGPVFSLVNFSGKKFNAFAERHITGTVEGETMSGNPDGMIASGWREPEIPYFCFQEYKREKDPEGDPAGQCLAAMLVAQELNEHTHPVYGCYTVGRNWFFMMLQEREYAISRVYPATNDDVFDIFRILKALKQIINNIVERGK
ncbi:hypothetical protein QUF72_16005 [Desulfobacterales bacterium HSG2]|nr:hypothetical protein [Desulfobacterales bacterium HSG2]